MSQDLKLYTLNRDPNPNAQFDIGNWVAFADAAGTAPVDGTGGSPNVTVARTTSTPLDGVASFLLTKDAANRQGQGWSADRILQPDDATKMFTWSFDYQITTGTYTGYQTPPSFSDLTAWFYDVTNSVMYQVMGYQIDAAVSTTNQYSFQGQVQIPVGCLTGRIILFLGNTGTSAFTARINNISFGRIALGVAFSTPFSQIVRGTAATKGGSSSGETTVVNYSAAITSVGTDITFTGRTTTTGDKYTINTTGVYCVWLSYSSGGAGDQIGITVNSSGLSTNVQSLTLSQVPCSTDLPVANRQATLCMSVPLSVNDVVRAQTEAGSTPGGATTTRFGIARVS